MRKESVTKVNILGVGIDALNRQSLKGELKSMLSGQSAGIVVKINSEFLLRSQEEAAFGDILNGASLAITDGVGVQWAAEYLSKPLTKIPVVRELQSVWQMIWTGASLVLAPGRGLTVLPERFPGVEALRLMLGVAEKENAPVYFFGAHQEILDSAIAKIKTEFPSLKVAGSNEGWHYKDEEVISDINKSKAKLLIVALGSPKQEYWINDNLPKLKHVKIAVGEGGSLDRIAYPGQKAPKVINRLGLEWLWRLLMNKSKTQTGSRLKRVWNAVPVYIYKVVKYKIQNG